MEGEARYMRRKVKAGLIEADHAQCAIVVHYEVEATVLGDMGEPIVAERQENTKVIKLKTLGPNTNVDDLTSALFLQQQAIAVAEMVAARRVEASGVEPRAAMAAMAVEQEVVVMATARAAEAAVEATAAAARAMVATAAEETVD